MSDDSPDPPKEDNEVPTEPVEGKDSTTEDGKEREDGQTVEKEEETAETTEDQKEEKTDEQTEVKTDEQTEEKEEADKEKGEEDGEEKNEDNEEEDAEVEAGLMDYAKEESSLKDDLRKVEVKSPELKEKEPEFDPDLFPPSYQNNFPKEQRVITLCKRFLIHYNYLFNRRRPLFLKPLNEFGVKKQVCTTINPTQLPYKDLLDWPDIADFVATYLVYKKLPCPVDLPETLYAPQTVLSLKKGHCFEFSTLLCSMLIGSGYDAYVVSGYATREVSTLDCSYTRCPLIEDDVTLYPKPQTLNIRRYTVRPPRWNQSEYLLRMKMKKNAVIKAEEDRVARIKEMQREMDEAPPEDELEGWRVHSWVIVLKGSRDIDQSFFIEPTRGVAYPLDWDGYQGVESLWNHYNYYINVQQEVPDTMEGLNFDIGDSTDWEYLFAGQDLHVTMTKSEIDLQNKKLEEEGDQCEEEAFFDLPVSWSLPLTLSRADYDLRYPTGKTSRRYKRSRVELFAEYLDPDGLVKKLYVYYDLECTDLFYTWEYFAHRSDLLTECFTHHPSGKVIEYFLDGRNNFLKEHHYYAHTPGPETSRTLIFFNNRRTDALYKREESSSFLKEWYDPRPDRKLYRETNFGPDGYSLESGIWPEARPIESLIEEFSRNPSVPANEDIARVTYGVCIDEIDIEYHVEESRLYGSTRHFTKPPQWWDEGRYLDWNADLHWNFEADVYAKTLCELTLFQMMVKLMGMESKSRALTRKSEKETMRLLQTRATDIAKLQLMRTYVDADIVPSNRVARLKEKARLKAELILKKSDILKDYLEPYLHRFGLSKVTNKKQAVRITENLMSDLKDRLLFTADFIKSSCDSLKEDVYRMQMMHAFQFSKLSAKQMEDYKDELHTKLFIGHILGQRLIAFKNYAPIKYKALYEQIKADPRMENFMK